jgi:hypothetical protein
MTAEDVKSKSKTETVERDISFPLTVPAHEGRLVSVKTIIASTGTFYEANLRAEGTVGIEVDPGWWKPNEFHFFYNIDSVFPYAEARSRITCGLINTDIETKVIKAKPTDVKGATDKKDAEILDYYLSFDFDQPAAALKNPDNLGFAVSSDTKDSSAGPPTGTVFKYDELHIRVQFAGLSPEVPPQDRRPDMRVFWSRIEYSSDMKFLRPAGKVNFGSHDDYAVFTLKYDSTKTTKSNLAMGVLKQSTGMKWGDGKDKVKISFP